MASIESLPPEIRTHIIDLVVDIWPKMAGVCASVSRLWQAHVEIRSFASLRLDQTRLEAARRIMTPARQKYVRHVRMEVCLPNYDNATLYAAYETAEEEQKNNQVFTEAIIDLFGVLKRWDQPGRQDPGVHLELYAFALADLGEPRTVTSRRHFQKLRWKHSYLSVAKDTWNGLPSLGMVTTFAIPRRLPERHFMASTCCEIASRLPNLHTVVWELSDNEQRDPSLRMQMRQEFAASLSKLPSSLRHFSMRYTHIPPSDQSHQPPRAYHEEHSASDPLSTSLRKLSQRLDTLTLDGSFVLDSSLFCPSSPAPDLGESLHWPRLREVNVSIAEATPSGTWLCEPFPGRRYPPRRYAGWEYFEDVAEEEPQHRFREVPVPELMDKYCLAAARAVASMPKLTRMVVRFTTDLACTFGYDVTGGGRSAAFWFESTPAFQMPEETREAWRAAARTHIGDRAEINIDLVDLGDRMHQISTGSGLVNFDPNT